MRARIFQFRVIRKFKISHIASKILRIFNRMLVLISLRLWRLESGKISERRCIKFINFQKFCSKKRLTRLSTATYQLKIFSDSLAEIRFLQVFFGISTLLGFRSFSEISSSSSSSDICSQFLKWSTDTITQTVNTAVVVTFVQSLKFAEFAFLLNSLSLFSHMMIQNTSCIKRNSGAA